MFKFRNKLVDKKGVRFVVFIRRHARSLGNVIFKRGGDVTSEISCRASGCIDCIQNYLSASDLISQSRLGTLSNFTNQTTSGFPRRIALYIESENAKNSALVQYAREQQI